VITYSLSEEGVTAALTALGNDPDLIAETLRAAGCKGIRDDESYCPVAIYVRRVLLGADEVYAWQGGVWVGWSWMDENGLDQEPAHFDWRPSPAFAAFIEMFDAGIYPELIEEASNA
jgi:hypothetical protein